MGMPSRQGAAGVRRAMGSTCSTDRLGGVERGAWLLLEFQGKILSPPELEVHWVELCLVERLQGYLQST